MKLSTKGRYGLRALVDLAVHTEGDSHQPLSSIAERQNISEIYLEQVFSTLRKAGIVQSIKGPQGGYFLTDPPASVTVGSVLRALEGELSVMDDKVKNDTGTRSITYCVKVNVWERIDRNVNRLVDALTLEDLVNEYQRLGGDYQPMYYI